MSINKEIERVCKENKNSFHVSKIAKVAPSSITKIVNEEVNYTVLEKIANSLGLEWRLVKKNKNGLQS